MFRVIVQLPWLRFFCAFSSVVRQIPGYNSPRRGTARTVPIYFCVVLCIFLCCSVYCLCVNVYCTAAVLFVCKCVLYCCQRVSTQLQLTNTSYHIICAVVIAEFVKCLGWAVLTEVCRCGTQSFYSHKIHQPKSSKQDQFQWHKHSASTFAPQHRTQQTPLTLTFLTSVRNIKCAFEEALSLSSNFSVINLLITVRLMTTPLAAPLLRHIFLVYVQTEPRIHKTGYRSWQDCMQMENCGRTHQIRGWRGLVYWNSITRAATHSNGQTYVVKVKKSEDRRGWVTSLDSKNWILAEGLFFLHQKALDE
jgi:hypothetical protein